MRVVEREVKMSYDDTVTVEMSYGEMAQIYLALGVTSDRLLGEKGLEHGLPNIPKDAYRTYKSLGELLKEGGFLK